MADQPHNPQEEPQEPIAPQEEHIQDDPGYSYEDIQKESVREIAENTEEPKKPEEKKEEPKEEKPPVEEPKLDPKQLAEDAAKSALEAQEAKRKADEEALQAQKQADPTTEYQEIVKDFEKKEGRTPTWEELAVKIEERTIEKLEARQAEKAKVEAEERVRQEKQAQTEKERLNTYVDDRLALLYQNNMLTPMKDKSNPSDQGVVERRALFAEMAKRNEERRAQGKELIYDPVDIVLSGWKRPTTNQVPGADAPVAGNQSSQTPSGSEEEYSYADIKKPWSFWKRG